MEEEKLPVKSKPATMLMKLEGEDLSLIWKGGEKRALFSQRKYLNVFSLIAGVFLQL